MKTILLPLLLFPLLLFAQHVEMDSLRRVIAKAPNREFRLLNQYYLAMYFHNADSIQQYGRDIIFESEKIGFKEGIACGTHLLGDYYLFKGQKGMSLPYYRQADSLYALVGETGKRMVNLSNLGYALENLGQFGDGIACYSTQIGIAESISDTNNMGSALRSLGACLMRQQKYREAIPYLKRGLMMETFNNPMALSFQNLGNAYYNLNMQDSALYFLNEGLKSAEKFNQFLSTADLHRLIGATYISKGDIKQAEEHLKKSLSLYEKANTDFGIVGLYTSLSDLELAKQNYQLALDWTNKALDIMALNNEQGIWERKIEHNLYAAYWGLGKYKEACDHLLAWKTASDSLTMKDNVRKIAEVETKYRTHEQTALIEHQQLQIDQQRHLLIIIMLTLLLFGAIAYIGRSRSIQRKKETEHELVLKQSETDRLKELDKVKSAFFANISHEFRTPLTLLIGPLKELESGVFKGNTLKYFGMMRRNAERLLQLVNQLLDLSRLEGGRLTLMPQPGNLNTALRAIAGSFESLAARKQIHFDVFIPNAPIWVFFDRDKLEKIVANLLSNAFKFTAEEGTVRLEVRLINQNESKEGELGKVALQLVVADTGIGIPADQLPHIFERFYRVENQQTDTPEGSGIGLALANELVKLHEGDLKVNSQLNKGTEFEVNIKFSLTPAELIVKEQANEPLEESIEPQLIAEVEKAKPITSRVILVVEDNEDLRSYISGQLDDQYRIIEANNGVEAMELATMEIPDLILTDVMMPEMDGMSLAKLLKKDPRTSHIPIVMLTAKSERGDRIEGHNAGAEAYLTKPFDAEELKAVTGRLVEQRKVLQDKYSKQVVLGVELPAMPSVDERFLQDVMKVVEENLDDDLFGVEQLATAVNMSRSNLFRKLDALLGKNPTHFIREMRLARAKQLIEQGAGNITEVAMMSGFNTPAYFVKCFVDQYGITPGELRKKHVMERELRVKN